MLCICAVVVYRCVLIVLCWLLAVVVVRCELYVVVCCWLLDVFVDGCLLCVVLVLFVVCRAWLVWFVSSCRSSGGLRCSLFVG